MCKEKTVYKNKNVGILTLPLINNYGGILQAFALKKTIEKLGYRPILIDYHKKDLNYFELVSHKFKNFIKCTVFKNDAKLIFQTPEISRFINKNAADFISLELSPKTDKITSFQQLSDLNEYFSAFIVGSDQVWRPEYTPEIARYFLDFVAPSNKRISYAASFGVDSPLYSEDQLEYCKAELKKFKLITVREDVGKSVLDSTFGIKNSEHVLDPTLLLSQSDYTELFDKYPSKASKGQVFCYILDNNYFSKKVVDKVICATKLHAFQVKPKPADSQYFENKEDYVYPHIVDWLRAFHDAEYVVVDSFHGCVFSIIFNKPFLAIGNKKRGLSRFTSLLRLFDLDDRLVLTDSNLDMLTITRDYDWSAINTILKNRRDFSIDLLLNSLND
ncbi:polysaccharide pyruvyl transferase family protein [Photobacterium damselae]|uniref:polysaccharide pyruvyl transferase family protein n=1 Tax=Photobacterium damselae TaxID=38293 RepID=UPI003B66C236